MKTSLRTIGMIAKEAGVSVETIRFYERRGLIAKPDRLGNKYRHYPDEILAQVNYIKTAKSLGMSLKDIEKLRSQIVTRPTFCASVKVTISQKLEMIDKQIDALQALKHSLQDFQARCKSRKPNDCPLFKELANLGLAFKSTINNVK